MAEGSYEFRPKPTVLTWPELDELLRVAPPADALAKGFTLQEADVDRVVQAAREIEGAQVALDPNVPPQQTVDVLLRVVRLLQSAIDVQFSEVEELTTDFNELQNNEVRRLREENNRLRELRDRDGVGGDAGELRKRNEDLLDQLDEMEEDLKRLREVEAEVTARNDELETSIKEREKDVLKLQTRLGETNERYDRVRDDYKDLQQRYRTLSQEFDRLRAEAQLQDTKHQSEWKIERLTKDNRALELANTELRKELTDVKTENLEVSEKILELNNLHQELLSKNGILEARAEEMANDKDNLLSIQDELRTELQDKMTLLDEFEDKFSRQYRSWEDEKAGLLSQIDALKRELRTARKDTGGGPGGGGLGDEELDELRRELNDAREKEILLLEAYEQLEADVGKEVDRALSRQAEEVARLKRRVDFLQGKLEQQDDDAEDTRDQMEELETQLKDALERNKKYEAQVYGLPQAVEEIRQLKSALTKEEHRVRDLIGQLNKQAGRVEDLHDENTVLRNKLGLGENDRVDIKDIKMQKEATLQQLRALNALLERQVADLEEERRKLRLEMKFRAKYHGQHALEMGLSNEKLLLLEQYVDDLKNNRVEEARVVDQMAKRIEFLEVRLAEVMAYADIPPSMRPALSEFDPTGMGMLSGVLGMGGAGAGLPGSKLKDVEAVRKVVQDCMRRLRNMGQSLQEKRNVSDEDYKRYVDHISGELQNADKMLEALVKDAAAMTGQGAGDGTPGSPGAGGPPSPGRFLRGSQGGLQMLAGDANYLADAMAEELRERMRELARQVADLQLEVASKDVRIQQLVEHKDMLEKKFGVSMGDRKSEYVTIAEYEGVQLEVQGLKEQLISTLEELASREREVNELHDSALRYHSKMQTMSDQVKLLYREYAGALAAWKVEKSTIEKKSKKNQADADAYKIATRELQTALDTLSKSRDMTEVEREYLDTVRRMAVVQIKQAKLARELQASVAGERSLTERVTELEEEVRDVSSTARGRIRWLEQSGEQTRRRLEQLFRELEASVPLTTYQALVNKHTRLSHEYRKKLEEAADAITAPGQDEVFRLRDELNEFMVRFDQQANQNAELKAKLHQTELLVAALEQAQPPGSAPLGAQPQAPAGTASAPPAEKPAPAHPYLPQPPTLAEQQQQISKLLLQPKLASVAPAPPPAAQPAAPRTTSFKGAGGQQPLITIDNVLAQELVAARVQEEGALRRAELVERERDRVQRSLVEMQEHGKELEQRMAQTAAELELARQTASALEKRMQGGRTKEEVDELMRRMHVAEAAAAEVQQNHSDMIFKAEDAERRAEAAIRDRRQHLAEITNLKAALREMSGKSDKAALLAKLHLELDHSRSKESLARNALNRSELNRIELEKEVRRHKEELANMTGRMTAHQDQAAWAERQRHEAQAALKIALAGRVETWKARLWARKLEALKSKNDALADGLEVARSRVLKLEDARQEAELKLEFKEDLAGLAQRGTSELAREVARLGEQLLQLRLEKGKVQREDMLLREKVHYLERVNAELHDLLDKYEGEHFSEQSTLEADRSAAETRALSLQEEVVRLQEKINQLLASRDLGGDSETAKALRASMRAAGGKGGYKANAGDRDQMIAMIENLRLAREEAEHLRTDNARLRGDYEGVTGELEDVRRHHRDALDRLAQQSEALMYALNQFKTKGADDTVFQQMKAVAEATINELKARVKERDRLIGQLRGQLDEEAAKALERHREDRAEIERLNQKLFELNDQTIQDLKSVLDRLPLKQAGQQVPEEVLRLRDALERAQDMITVLKNRLEQKDAAIDMLKLSYEQQIKQLNDDMLRVRADADARALARDDGPVKVQLQKVQAQLKLKDDMLRQLKAAIKALEAKLAQVMKEHADEKMQMASWQAQERMQEQLDKLTQERDELLRRLALAEDNAAAAGGVDAAMEDQLEQLRRRIHEEVEKRTRVERQLFLVKDELAKFKNAKEAVVDLTTGMSIEARRQIDDLQKKINVLEKQNATLKRKAQALDALGVGGGDGGSGGPGGGGGDDGPDGPGGRRPTGRIPSSRRQQTGSRRLTGHSDQDAAGAEDQAGGHDPEEAERRERALAQWEEGKKLGAKIEHLKKQLAAKSSEVVGLQKDLERRAVQASAVQAEADKQAAAIRDLTEKLRRAQEAPRTDRAKLQEYMERCGALEEAKDGLAAELARLKQQLQALQGGSGGAAPSSPGGARLQHESELFELRLERDQLQAQVRRLRERLAELSGEAEGGPGRRAGSAGARGGAAGPPGSVTAAREAELMSTITNLKAALEKANANTTPTTKYMAEVSRRKEAQKDLDAARGELERLRQQLGASGRMVAELQSANAELRRQARSAQQQAAAGGAAGGGVAELGLQLSNLEMLLGQREEEAVALRGALAQRDAELESIRGPAEPGGGGPLSAAELSSLRRQVRELEAENQDLRNELNAFDPSFWDEVMDMKQQHAELSRRVQQYEEVIVQLSDRLGVAPPLAVGRGGAGGSTGRGGREDPRAGGGRR